MQKFKRSSMKETRNILNSCKIRVCEKVQAFLHEGNQKHSEFLAPRYWRSILLAQNIVNPFLFSAEQLSYLNVLLYWQKQSFLAIAITRLLYAQKPAQKIVFKNRLKVNFKVNNLDLLDPSIENFFCAGPASFF